MTKKRKATPAVDVDEAPAEDRVEHVPEESSEPEQEQPPAEAEEETPEEKPIAPPSPPKPAVALRVFLQVAGSKWDQLAGFKAYAKAQRLEARSIPEWHAAVTEYKNRPVG
jgi:hypothetical protein